MRINTANKTRNVFFAFALTLIGCTHSPPLAEPGQGAFPFGSYQHLVHVHVNKNGVPDMDLRGVVRASDQRIQVVGLSTMNTTLFRIDENLRTGEIKKEFYLDVMRKHESRFMEFYKLIRALLTLPKGVTEVRQNGAQFLLSQPDDRGIYRRISILHPYVQLQIEVSDYALE